MTVTIKGEKHPIAYIEDSSVLMTDAQSALDLLMTVQYESGCRRVILNKSVVCEEFFILSKGIAGDILQKVVNYCMKLAIVGDYSGYTSQPLQDFIWESNQGNAVFFVSTLSEAVQKLDTAD